MKKIDSGNSRYQGITLCIIVIIIIIVLVIVIVMVVVIIMVVVVIMVFVIIMVVVINMVFVIIMVVVIIRSSNNLCQLNVIHVWTGDDSPDGGKEDEALEAQAAREGICERSISFHRIS